MLRVRASVVDVDGSAECGPRLQELARECVPELLAAVGDEADAQHEFDPVVARWQLKADRRSDGIPEHLVQSALAIAPILARDSRQIDEMARLVVETQFERALGTREDVARRDEQISGLAHCGPSA